MVSVDITAQQNIRGAMSVAVLQARHASKREKGVVNYVYKLCPPAPYSVVQSCYSVLAHDTLHHCLSSNENSDRELGHRFCYCRCMCILFAFCTSVTHAYSLQGACELCNRHFKSVSFMSSN